MEVHIEDPPKGAGCQAFKENEMTKEVGIPSNPRE
jgi:hypothetical protein